MNINSSSQNFLKTPLSNTKVDINQINDNVLFINEQDKNEIYHVVFTKNKDRKTSVDFVDVNDNNIKETLNKLKNKNKEN